MARSLGRPEPRILDARLIDHEVELVSGHDLAEVEAVSYTHLTLPTICSV